jgi:hypothetical protein
MFCMNVFQDGIYWIEDKPTHPISIFIIGQLGDLYRDWARHEFAEGDEQINCLEPQSKVAVDRMKENVQARFEQPEEREWQREHLERQLQQSNMQMSQMVQAQARGIRNELYRQVRLDAAASGSNNNTRTSP